MNGPEKESLYVVVVAGVVLEQEGKFLLVQERKESVRGLWNLPAGRVEVGDTLEGTAAKEAKEETGYDVEIQKHLGAFHEKADEAVKHAFKAKIIGGQLEVPQEEILDARWFTLKELEAMQSQLRNAPWILGAIKMSQDTQ